VEVRRRAVPQAVVLLKCQHGVGDPFRQGRQAPGGQVQRGIGKGSADVRPPARPGAAVGILLIADLPQEGLRPRLVPPRRQHGHQAEHFVVIARAAPRASPCARPQALIKGKPGVRLELTVTFEGARRHLPIVALRRVA